MSSLLVAGRSYESPAHPVGKRYAIHIEAEKAAMEQWTLDLYKLRKYNTNMET